MRTYRVNVLIYWKTHAYKDDNLPELIGKFSVSNKNPHHI